MKDKLKWMCDVCGQILKTEVDLHAHLFNSSCERELREREAAQPSEQRDRLCENCGEPMSQHLYGPRRVCKNGEWNNWGRDARRR